MSQSYNCARRVHPYAIFEFTAYLFNVRLLSIHHLFTFCVSSLAAAKYLFKFCISSVYVVKGYVTSKSLKSGNKSLVSFKCMNVIVAFT